MATTVWVGVAAIGTNGFSVMGVVAACWAIAGLVTLTTASANGVCFTTWGAPELLDRHHNFALGAACLAVVHRVLRLVEGKGLVDQRLDAALLCQITDLRELCATGPHEEHFGLHPQLLGGAAGVGRRNDGDQ